MAKKAEAWMPLWIGDYLADTQRLTCEQHGAYLLLIFDYWRSGPPPDDDDTLRSICKLDAGPWRKHRPVLERMFQIRDGHWHHRRIDAEIANARDNQDRRSARAEHAASIRWGNASSNAPGMPDAIVGECPSPSPSPVEDKSSTLSRKRGHKLPDDFEPVLTENAQANADTLGETRFVRELQKFRDHHRAKGTTMKDWQAAFRTWLGNAVDWNQGKSNGNGSRHEAGRNGLLGAVIDAERAGRA